MTEVSGICPIVATPFAESGEVDYGSLRREIRALADGGCHGATLFGIAGEFYKLSQPERERIVDEAVAVAEETDLTLIASVTHDATHVATGWAESYAGAGVDALMVFPPTMGGVTADGVVDHLEAIGNAVSIPVTVQHTPQNVAVPASKFAELHESTSNVRYFKVETEPPGPFITELLEETNGGVDVLVGSCGRPMIDAYERGAVGAMPTPALHELYVSIHDALEAGDTDRAADLHSEMLGIQNQFSYPGIVRGDKYLLEKRGIIDSARLREPSSDPMDAHQKRVLDRYFDRIERHLKTR